MLEKDGLLSLRRFLLRLSGILRERLGVLEGQRVLVTAGGTVERIDPVRYITNDSSGKMGYAIAEEAVRMGAKVTLVSGPSRITRA